MIGFRAKQALRRTAEWDKRTLGMASLLPPVLKRPLARAMRRNLLPEGRRFIATEKVENLFSTLRERDAAYVVIRWFEALPQHVEGDIDFLVADEALPMFEELLDDNRSGIPCDVYSESGVPGYRYGNIAYYPPGLAERILARRTLHENLVSVPSAEDHFFSLAFHCLYHKGADCGLHTLTPGMRTVAVPKHDYLGTLTSLADKLDIKVEVTMEGLDKLLQDRGWRPDRDILERLSIDNLWLRKRLAAPPHDVSPATVGAASHG